MTVKPMEIAGELPDHEGRLVPCVTLEQAEGYANERVRLFVEYLCNHAEALMVRMENDACLAQHPNRKASYTWYSNSPNEPGADDE